MNTAIVFASPHHGNTKKLLDAIASAFPEVTLIDAIRTPEPDLSGNDAVGFASGIYYSKLHKSVLRVAQERLPQGVPVFFLYTCGMRRAGYTKAVADAAAAHGARVLGEYGALGYNTYGLLRLIGGMGKGHPDSAETDGAVAFYRGVRDGLRV